MKKWIIALNSVIFIFAATSGVQAVEKSATDKQKPVQEAPKVKAGYVPRAEITITESKEMTFKEYRIDGALRAIKVTPKNGFPPYYLIDREGTGEFVRVGPDMGPQVQVPQWILFEW